MHWYFVGPFNLVSSFLLYMLVVSGTTERIRKNLRTRCNEGSCPNMSQCIRYFSMWLLETCGEQCVRIGRCTLHFCFASRVASIFLEDIAILIHAFSEGNVRRHNSTWHYRPRIINILLSIVLAMWQYTTIRRCKVNALGGLWTSLISNLKNSVFQLKRKAKTRPKLSSPCATPDLCPSLNDGV